MAPYIRDASQKSAVTETKDTHQQRKTSTNSSSSSNTEENGSNQSCNNCSGKFVDNSAKYCHNCGTHRQ